jgi:ribose/xylose/arabinose/galactoside ABC-type transport system permease subunit
MRIKFGLNYQVMLAILLVVLIVGFGLIEPVFFYPDVLFDVTAIIGEIGIMALAMTFIITTGGIDLSVGYILQLSAIVFGAVFAASGNLALAIVLALLTGTASGFFNGLIISKTKIPPLVTTLATMNLYRGLSMIIAGTNSYSGFPAVFKKFSTIMIFGVVPIQFIYFLVFFFLFNLFYARGSLGRNLKGIGFNENALIFSGIKTQRIKLFIYTLSGLMCAFAALVYLGRLSSAKTSMGNDLNLQVITAVVLGGTSTMGGVGSIVGTFIGVLIIGVLKKGFTLLNFSGNIFNFTLGVMLIVALIAFSILERSKLLAGKLKGTQRQSSHPSGEEAAGSQLAP